jgi:tetratricopeptide (TPR) repeat protein
MPLEFAELAIEWTTSRSRLLITSRDPDVPFPVHRFALRDLTLNESVSLLIAYLDKAGVCDSDRQNRQMTHDSIVRLASMTGGCPLAIELIAHGLLERDIDAVTNDLRGAIAQAEQDHVEARNRSVRASLDVSMRHLSERAHTFLALFRMFAGGAPVKFVEDVAGVPHDEWLQVQAEYVSLGLVKVASSILRPHPLLAALDVTVSETQEATFVDATGRFCAALLAEMGSPNWPDARKLLSATESVVRRAIDIALKQKEVVKAWAIVDIFSHFLDRCGRRRDAHELVLRISDFVPLEAELTPVEVKIRREAAWAIVQSEKERGIEMLVTLKRELEELEARSGDAPITNRMYMRHERMLTLRMLARVYTEMLADPAQAQECLRKATLLETDIDEAGFSEKVGIGALNWERATALALDGRFDDAISTLDLLLAECRRTGDNTNEARVLAHQAQFLTRADRYQDAAAKYDEAIRLARAVGDNELQGMLFQHLGVLYAMTGSPYRAYDELKEAFKFHQVASNRRGQMQVANSLADVERQRGNLDAALEWVELARAGAEDAGDRSLLFRATMGRGLLHLDRAKSTRDTAERASLLEKAIADEQSAVEIASQLGRPDVAQAHANLAFACLEAQEFDKAKQHAMEALRIYETINVGRAREVVRLLGEIHRRRVSKKSN